MSLDDVDLQNRMLDRAAEARSRARNTKSGESVEDALSGAMKEFD